GVPGSLARGPIAGLALANTVTTLVESGVLWWLMRRRIHGVNDSAVLNMVWRTTVATGVLSIVLWVLNRVLTDANAFVHLATGGAVGALLFFGVGLALRVEEARTVPNIVISRLRR
ncbi:MAG: hypothetical protein AAF125_23985, partial [Chloroflexota bacterium]